MESDRLLVRRLHKIPEGDFYQVVGFRPMNIGARVIFAVLATLILYPVAAFCQLYPTPPEAVARVILCTGQVSVMRDSVPWVLSAGDVVGVKELIVTGPDGYAVFELADGSRFEVFPNSRVTFRNNPSSLTDLLDVWIGRVKVFVQRLTGISVQRRVFTPTAIISVRGTVFYVEVEDGGDATLVVVESGEVEVRHALLPSNRTRVVREGEWLRVYKDVPLAKSRVDRDSVLRATFRAIAEALYSIAVREPTSSGGTTVGSTPPGTTAPPTRPLPGDRPAPEPPPPPNSGDRQPSEQAPPPAPPAPGR